MLEEKIMHPCENCCRDHCVNRGNIKIAKLDRSCYVQSKCAECIASAYCNNPEKDKVPLDLTKSIEDAYSLKKCFVEPKTCNDCFLRSHCKNKKLKGISFKLDLSKSTKPLCFSLYHSYK